MMQNGGVTVNVTNSTVSGSSASNYGGRIYNSFGTLNVTNSTFSGNATSKPKCDIGAFESQGFTLAIAGGDGQSTLINMAFTNPLSVTMVSGYGELVNGQVTFTAQPGSSGQSAVISGSPATIGADGKASVSATANGTIGAYKVTASAPGATSVDFALTNTGILPTFTSASSTVMFVGVDGAFTVTTSGTPAPH